VRRGALRASSPLAHGIRHLDHWSRSVWTRTLTGQSPALKCEDGIVDLATVLGVLGLHGAGGRGSGLLVKMLAHGEKTLG
jgi:hypothetical protein